MKGYDRSCSGRRWGNGRLRSLRSMLCCPHQARLRGRETPGQSALPAHGAQSGRVSKPGPASPGEARHGANASRGKLCSPIAHPSGRQALSVATIPRAGNAGPSGCLGRILQIVCIATVVVAVIVRAASYIRTTTLRVTASAVPVKTASALWAFAVAVLVRTRLGVLGLVETDLVV